jgi:hypothetical protein
MIPLLIWPVRFGVSFEPEFAADIWATRDFISADLESPKTDFDGAGSPFVGVPGFTPSVGFVPTVDESLVSPVVEFFDSPVLITPAIMF